MKRLPERTGGPQWWVRINPIGSQFHKDDLEMIGSRDIAGIVLPKAESGADVLELAHRTGNVPIHAIVTETAASLFNLDSYRDPALPLVAMSWGAEDLSAALGASSKYDDNGELAFTYKLARSLCLAGAVAAGVQPIDGIFADFADEHGLRAEAEAAQREGFTGKLAIHPAQVKVINDAFTPTPEEIGRAKAVIAAFDEQPGAGVVSVNGRMVDRPHLIQAKRVLARARDSGDGRGRPPGPAGLWRQGRPGRTGGVAPPRRERPRRFLARPGPAPPLVALPDPGRGLVVQPRGF